MVDALSALGGEGKTAAQALGRKIMTRYRQLIERDIGRGRLDKAADFAERMDEVAARADLPRDQAALLSARVEQAVARRQDHARLVREAEQLRDQGKLVGPHGEYALARAAEVVELGFDSAEAEALLGSIIRRQRERADRLTETGRLREAARELNMLADALLSADIDRTALVADFRVRAATLYRRADREDSERERQAAAAARPADEAPVEDDRDDNPFTFINPF
jgi:hypothetical protein